MSSEFPQRIAFDEAIALVRDAVTRAHAPTETALLSDALGRVLARDVVASMALPPFDNAAMDGFALRGADLDGPQPLDLQLVGEQFAGLSRDLKVESGQCVRITTGAPLPAGADTVVIKEETVLAEGRVRLACSLRPGANVRLAGEDVRVGDTVLTAGARLTPPRLALAASLGLARLDLARLPRVHLFSTGDELRAPGEPLRKGEIYDSNTTLLRTLLHAEGIDARCGHLPDDPAQIAEALDAAAATSELILTCGGVSAGEKDHLPALLQAFGEPLFWRVRMKPGMPVLFGRWKSSLLLGLPGNPVSVMATFLTLGRELLDGLQGCCEPRPTLVARLAAPLGKSHSRLEFQRAKLHVDADGVLTATPDAVTGSHRLHAAAAANGLLRLPEGPQSYASGDKIDVLPIAPLASC